MKTTNLLMIAGAVFLGYKFAPESVKEQLPFGSGESGGTSVVNITENPFDWTKLTDALSGVKNEMPFPDMPEWILKPPEWIDKARDVTAIPAWFLNPPDWFNKAKDFVEGATGAVNPDGAGVVETVKEFFDTLLDTAKKAAEAAKPDVVPNKAGTSPEIGGFGRWFEHLRGGWQDVFDFLNPFDIAKHFYGTDAYRAENLLTGYARNVQPRPERSFGLGQAPIITEASPVRQRPVFSGGSPPRYTPVSPMPHPAIKGISIVGVLGGSPTPIGTLAGRLPPVKAERWMFT